MVSQIINTVTICKVYRLFIGEYTFLFMKKDIYIIFLALIKYKKLGFVVVIPRNRNYTVIVFVSFMFGSSDNCSWFLKQPKTKVVCPLFEKNSPDLWSFALFFLQLASLKISLLHFLKLKMGRHFNITAALYLSENTVIE